MEGEEERLGRALEAVAPWCMAQQYGTRVVAQVSKFLFALGLSLSSFVGFLNFVMHLCPGVLSSTLGAV